MRVDLPSYRVLELDAKGRTALVEVPDRDLPADPDHVADLTRDATRLGGRRTWPRQRSLDAWHHHLDARYEQHAGRYRPIPC